MQLEWYVYFLKWPTLKFISLLIFIENQQETVWNVQKIEWMASCWVSPFVNYSTQSEGFRLGEKLKQGDISIVKVKQFYLLLITSKSSKSFPRHRLLDQIIVLSIFSGCSLNFKWNMELGGNSIKAIWPYNQWITQNSSAGITSSYMSQLSNRIQYFWWYTVEKNQTNATNKQTNPSNLSRHKKMNNISE